MEIHAVFKLFLTIRTISVFLVQTYFVPDEYFQSLEIAHNLVFKYGYVTWEWRAGIRSYIPVLFVAAIFKILEAARLDYPLAIVYAPRFVQAVFSAFSDFCFFKWAGENDWSIFIPATSWFWFYTSSRTLINTVEYCLTTIALSKFPWPGKNVDNNVFLWIAGVLINIRPTSVITWLPLCLFHLSMQKGLLLPVLRERYLPIGVATFVISVTIDSIAHGSFIITMYEFMKFNVFEGVASSYGVHRWYWYLTEGLAAVLGINYLPFILGCVYFYKKQSSYPNEMIMMLTMAFSILVFSLLAHKEHRFLLPILPLAFYLTSRYLTICTQKNYSLEVILTCILVIGNILPTYYFSQVHQSGTTQVMDHLRTRIRSVDDHILFLMPCHSTPLYSHLHVNVTTRFLECLPNLHKEEDYIDEADQFFAQPILWLRQNYPHTGKLPSHIVMFDPLLPYVSDVLLYLGYKETSTIPHTNFPISSRIGKEVLVFERSNL